MTIVSLVRNYIPSYEWVLKGGWNIADCVALSYDVEGMAVGTVAAGRIGLAVLKRLKPFDMQLHYTDRHRQVIWDFRAPREKALEFEAAYGSNGRWASPRRSDVC